MEPPGRQPPAPVVAGWPEADRRRLDALFDALAFPTPTSFRLADEPAVKVTNPPEGGDPNLLVEALWPFLYERCYARIFGLEGSGGTGQVPKPYQRDPEFTATLSAAHATRHGWDQAWQVSQVGSDGSVRVFKRDRFREVRPGQYAFIADPSRPPRVDESVDLLVCRESFIFQPGFYYAFGKALGCDWDDANQARMYFHATAEGMPRLLAAVSGALNHLDIPFLFKCRDDPNKYDRTDAALLVVSRRYLAVALRLLGQLDWLFDEVLKPGIPLFTRELRPGLGLADNPREAVSFGQLRCTLLAQGLVEALIAGRQGREARHQTVADCFARAGLDPSRPHLKPGSSDQYHRPDGEPWQVDVRHTGPPELGVAKDDAFLDVADRIGRRICRDAIWAGGRCNWMTWAVQTFSGRHTLVHRAASPGLFDGVAGIALFLAHLWRLTGDRQQGDALGGAIRQLLATAPKMTSLGFTGGRTGVRHALVAIGRLLEDDDLIEAGIGLREASGPLAGSPTDVTDWPSLSRIRELVGNKPGLAVELDATLRSASLSLSSPDASDLSLGRGLAGHADFLVEAAVTLNRADLRLVAEQFGRAIVERFHRPDLPWPCGVPGAGETPDLMTGTAGIGLTFLRLRDPASVPSPFLLQPMGG